MRIPPQPKPVQTMNAVEREEHRKLMKKLNPQVKKQMPRMRFEELASVLPVEESGEVDLYEGEE